MTAPLFRKAYQEHQEKLFHHGPLADLVLEMEHFKKNVTADRYINEHGSNKIDSYKKIKVSGASSAIWNSSNSHNSTSSTLAPDQQIQLRCQKKIVIGIHMRLGDVAEKYSESQRLSRAENDVPKGSWGTKYDNPQMHVVGLGLVWNIIPAECTRLFFVTDGTLASPEECFHQTFAWNDNPNQ